MTKKKILLVEDDQDIRHGLTLLLVKEYETTCCEDGISAMAMARREVPDAIVLDLGLPGGDGLKVLQWLRDLPEFAFTPKIVVTGRDGAAVEEQALNLGASVVFHKPADPAELLRAIRGAVDLPAPDRKKVLIVDDDPDTREALAIRLLAHDFCTWSAADGAGALSTAREQSPDLILLDLGLPGGDGFKVLERMRAIEELRDTPVIVLSGRDPDTHLERAIEAGAVMFLQKPPNEIELLDAIGAVL